MMDRLAFTQENRDRIQVVESSFGPSGKPLNRPGRVLVGEGRLKKLSRRRPQSKVFYLFNDVLVYGTIVLHGHWHKSQKIFPLENIQLEDLEDSPQMKNQWLIRTPRKSFYVSASSPEEKQAWLEHIEECRLKRLRDASCPSPTFAVTWIPDQASAICMRCLEKFNMAHRRHHCRNCGFVVCNNCSKYRAVIAHINPIKAVRVCKLCHCRHLSWAKAKERPRLNSNGTMRSFNGDISVIREYNPSSDEDTDDNPRCMWVPTQVDSFSPYVYLKPKHQKPTRQHV
ncbi:pleckstrin homology domain-containing family F member 1 [Aplochiton taeniatus]